MQRKTLAALAVLVFCYFSPQLLVRAAAAPFTSYFNDISAELQTRLNALVGTLTPAQKKEKTALTGAIKSIAKKSTSLTTDLKLAVSLSTKLDKSFPGDTVFDALLNAMLNNLAGEVQAQNDALEINSLNMVPGKTKVSTQQSILAANQLLIQFQSAPTHTKRAQNLSSALAFILKGSKGVAKASKVIVEGLVCKTNAFDFVSKTATFTLSATNFKIVANQTNGGNATLTIDYTIQSTFVSGGFYTLTPGTGSYTNHDTGEVFPIDGGSINVIALDLATTSISAVFSLSATGPTTGFLNISEGYLTSKHLVIQ